MEPGPGPAATVVEPKTPRQAVAFHAFKQVNQWYNCWLLSNNNGFWDTWDERCDWCDWCEVYTEKHQRFGNAAFWMEVIKIFQEMIGGFIGNSSKMLLFFELGEAFGSN